MIKQIEVLESKLKKFLKIINSIKEHLEQKYPNI